MEERSEPRGEGGSEGASIGTSVPSPGMRLNAADTVAKLGARPVRASAPYGGAEKERRFESLRSRTSIVSPGLRLNAACSVEKSGLARGGPHAEPVRDASSAAIG